MTQVKHSDIHAVIFDMDGLLIDTEKHLVECWMQAARMHGYELTREHALLLRSLTASLAGPLLKELYGEGFEYEVIRNTRKKLMNERLSKVGIEGKPGVKEALSYLKNRGYHLAVATATDRDRANSYLEEVGIRHFFDHILSTTMVPLGKPYPDIYLYACEQLGKSPKNCLALEDSPNGVRSAYRAGLRVIMVPDLTEPDDEIRQMLYASIPILSDLYKFV